MRKALLLASFPLVTFFLSPAFGQEVTGAIVGVLRDSSGSSVPNAALMLVSQETDAQRQTVSDETGSYQFLLLRAGRYRLIDRLIDRSHDF